MTNEEREQFHQRGFIYALTTFIIFVVILSRFFYIQILGSKEHYFRSEANRTREIEIFPTRGLIYDRNHILLVDNVPAYSVSAIPYELENKEFLFQLIDEHFSSEFLRVQDKLNGAITRYQPVKILRTDHAGLTYFEENRLDLPGVISREEPQRYYPSDIRASHFLGYIKEIDEDELKEFGKEYYKSGDIVGKKGIEKYYENLLRGEKGYKFMEVDALGREIDEIITPNTTPPIPGNDLILTIDKDLQKLSEDLLGDSLGAIIALNPQNGEIYAAVSRPDIDPIFMSGRFTQEEFDLLRNDPDKPLFNRVSQGMFPPGSTFKIIGALAAINEGILPAEQTYTCNGYFRLGNKIHECWKKAGHGTLNMAEAIEQSCNVYFYNLSQEIGLDAWLYYSRLFEFGKYTGLDLPAEENNKGILPTREYLDAKYGYDWNEKGQMAIMIIGQGDILTTPVQMARFAAAIGTKGKLIKPHFLKAAVNSKTDSVIYEPESIETQITEISDEAWEVVKMGMYNVVNGDSGTAKSVRHPEVPIAGKTGTAQNPHGQDHAWFIGYAPEDNPTIALAVFVENGGGGARVAAPIAREIFKKYFSLQKMRKDKTLSTLIK